MANFITIPKPDNMIGQVAGVDPNVDGINYFVDYLGKFSLSIIGTLGALAVLFIVFGALRMIISAGDKKAVEEAKGIIFHAVIGLLVAALSYAIVNMVINLPGAIFK